MYNSQGFGDPEVSSSRSHFMQGKPSYENEALFYRRKGRPFGNDENPDDTRRSDGRDADWKSRRGRDRTRERDHSSSQDSNDKWDPGSRDRDRSRERYHQPPERPRKVLLDTVPGTTPTCFYPNMGGNMQESLTSTVASSLTGMTPTSNMPGIMTGLDVSSWTMNASLNTFGMMGLGGDPNLLNMINMSGFNQLGFMGTTGDTSLMSTGMSGCLTEGEPTKEIIRLPSCVLYPPRTYPQLPVTREKPPGCRTVFVGGLPENITEEIVHEIFERCGEITAIRMSRKNFCHIRFDNETVVDNAIYFSGYRIKLKDSDDPRNMGRLHVDYAQARDDRYEWECKQRAIQREMRHRERLEQERLRPPSPPPIVHYSDFEASLLIEKIKGEESFQKAVQILITWLDRGECNKQNAGQFYSMIQSSNSHVRRLMNEKAQYEEELNQAKELMKQRMQGILIQFNQIYKVFSASSHQKVWDHFTKAQRKNIDLWRKQAEEIKNAHVEDVLSERIEAEMEVSDGEDEANTAKKPRIEADSSENGGADSANAQLREENDTLRCQIEAYENEIAVLRSESKQEKEMLEKQVKFLQQALQGMQHQLLTVTQQRANDEAEITKLQQMVKDQEKDASEEKEQKEQPQEASEALPNITESVQEASSSEPKPTSPEETTEKPLKEQVAKGNLTITEREACLIGIIGTFLHVHPFGAGVDYIWSYLQQMDSCLTPRDVETLMSKFPKVFKQELSGVGATLERKWTFCGFNSPALNQKTVTC